MALNGSPRPIYESSGYEVDLVRRELRSDGVPVPIGRRAFEVIGALVESAGTLITKDDLMDRVWPGAIVEDNTLQVHISAVRKALGARRDLLKTESGRGYRLLGSWTPRSEHATVEDSDAPAEPANGRSRLTNLPENVTTIVGRVAAVQRLHDLLSAYRIVTLTGPGGIGKTALALAVGRSVLAGFDGGAWLVELAALTDPGLVPAAVAGVLGLKFGRETISPAAVAQAIAGKRLLLVLDNSEHVVEAVAELTEMIVRQCPHATVLATSRETLRIDGEYVYRVPPLDVPPADLAEPERLMGHSAVALFIARIKALDTAFSPDLATLSSIAEICRHLDGIPLAIEFAAARAATLGIRQVAAGLEDRFTLLTSGRRTALPRHQTLRAVLDWSYDLLPADEQHLLRHLAVFNGGFTLEAATAVATGTAGVSTAIVDANANLVAKSLVAFDGTGATSRWRLLETIRAYAHEKLATRGEDRQAERRHANYFRDRFVPPAPASLLSATVENLEQYAREIDNVRAALDWSFSPRGDTATGIMLTAACVPVWLHLAMAECRERVEHALEQLAAETGLDPRFAMQLYVALAVGFLHSSGNTDRTGELATTSLELACRFDDAEAQLLSLWSLWSFRYIRGHHRIARSLAERFLEVANRTGDESDTLVGERLKGISLHFGGEQPEAQRLIERFLQLYAAPDQDKRAFFLPHEQRIVTRAFVARALCLQGQIDQARDAAQAYLQHEQGEGSPLTLQYLLGWGVCPVALITRDLATAEPAIAMLIEFAARYQLSFWSLYGRGLDGQLRILQGDFAAGVDLLRPLLQDLPRPYVLGALANGLGHLGDVAEALATIERALALAERDGEFWDLPELLRIKGELLLRQAADQAPTAADCFRNSLALAVRQGASFWELRTAVSLARLLADRGQRDEARQTLAPVYGRFTEGFASADLVEAKALLDALS
jgi:predicted ATPase/DNA-binding winged helix-turn-helix (wHTH) protein